MKATIRVLWQADKGTHPHQFMYLPQQSRFDGVGICFTRTAGGQIFLCNGDNNSVIAIDPSSQRASVYPRPFGREHSPMGVTCVGDHLFFAVDGNDGVEVVVTNTELKVHHRVRLSSRHFCPPVWVRAVPSVSRVWLSHYGIGMNAVHQNGLGEYDLENGALLRYWQPRPKLQVGGLAFVAGTIYVPEGVFEPAAGLETICHPKNFESSINLLVGGDQRRQFYWYAASPVKQQRSKSLAPRSVHLLCTDVTGRILKQMLLVGKGGLLTHQSPSLGFSLGWGGEWMEVALDGRVLLFAWDRSEKIKKAVGLYEVGWTD